MGEPIALVERNMSYTTRYTQVQKFFIAFTLSFTALWLLITTVFAQDEPTFTIRLNRDFGTAIGNRIQGTFSIRVNGPDNLERVIFYIDDQQLGEDIEAPFRLNFNTESFAPGTHTFRAVGFTVGGQELQSNRITPTIMTSEESREAFTSNILPVIIGIMVLAIAIPVIAMLFTKQKSLTPGTPRQYGVAGGAICPRCHRPYPRHVFSPNLLFGKLERCPFCGKWAIVAAAPMEVLRAAEAAERQALEEHVGDSLVSEEDKLRRRLDDSRFDE